MKVRAIVEYVYSVHTDIETTITKAENVVFINLF